MQYSIKELIDIKPYTITARFNTDEVLEIDLESKLKLWSSEPESIYNELLKPDCFKTARYDKEWEIIYWDNGVDFCSDMLYNIAKENITSEKTPQRNKDISDAIYLLFKNLNPKQQKDVFNQLRKDFFFK